MKCSYCVNQNFAQFDAGAAELSGHGNKSSIEADKNLREQFVLGWRTGLL